MSDNATFHPEALQRVADVLEIWKARCVKLDEAVKVEVAKENYQAAATARTKKVTLQKNLGEIAYALRAPQEEHVP